jgi:hypothetical protein
MDEDGDERFRLVDAGWASELEGAVQSDHSNMNIISPFIKKRTCQRLLTAGKPTSFKVITRFNLSDFANGVSDTSALRVLLQAGAQVRGIRNLHAKVYVFGNSRAIVTSANLTEAALGRNKEFGLVTSEASVIGQCKQYFDGLWTRAGRNLTFDLLDAWENTITDHLAIGGRANSDDALGDMGADLGFEATLQDPSPWISEADQAFVKFLGEGDNRVPLSRTTLEEVERAGCHWAVAYPASKRPRKVKDGALMYIARLTEEPNDIRIFGRAIGMKHIQGRDDATPEDMVVSDIPCK